MTDTRASHWHDTLGVASTRHILHITMPLLRRRLLTLPLLLAHSWAGAQDGAIEDETWTDTRRPRVVPVRVRWPGGAAPIGGWPLLLFSHGLGGARDGGSVWGEAWTAAGFVVVHLQHVGSDIEAVRRVAGNFGNQAALRQLAGPLELMQRLLDVRFVLDEVGRRQTAAQGRWSQVRSSMVGMSGHSYGAHTTLGMAGQTYPGFAGISEPRLASFIAFSPTVPAQDAEQAFAKLTQPLLSITGTRDDDVVGVGATPQRRMATFAALPPGNKAHLVLQDADHMSFAGQTGRAAEVVRREPITRDLQPAHHALIASITSDWWRATLMNDAQARMRLAAPSGLRPDDLWQQK